MPGKKAKATPESKLDFEQRHKERVVSEKSITQSGGDPKGKLPAWGVARPEPIPLLKMPAPSPLKWPGSGSRSLPGDGPECDSPDETETRGPDAAWKRAGELGRAFALDVCVPCVAAAGEEVEEIEGEESEDEELARALAMSLEMPAEGEEGEGECASALKRKSTGGEGEEVEKRAKMGR